MGKIIYSAKKLVTASLAFALIFSCYGCSVKNNGTENKTNVVGNNEAQTSSQAETSITSEESLDASMWNQIALERKNDATVTKSTAYSPEGFQSVSIVFRDHNPIQLDMVVPINWELAAENSSEIFGGFCSPVDIYVDGKNIGYIGNDVFDKEYQNISDEQYYLIYNQLMMSNHTTWNMDYKEVACTDTTHTATCTIYCDGALSGTQEEHRMGILSYDSQLLKYVCMDIAEASITEEQRLTIAESIRLSALEE